MKQQSVNNSTSIITNDEISAFIKKIKFKKRIFGGVDEYEVWKKIRKLDDMYSDAMKTQRIKYETLLAEMNGKSDIAFENEAEGIVDGKA